MIINPAIPNLPTTHSRYDVQPWQIAQKVCKNCKFWKTDKVYGLHGYCPELDRTDVDTNGAYSSDGIETGPDFGCIHFEEKL